MLSLKNCTKIGNVKNIKCFFSTINSEYDHISNMKIDDLFKNEPFSHKDYAV